MSSWKVPGDPDNPKGNRQNSNRPKPGPGEKAVLCLSSAATGTCQNPFLQSSLE